MKKIIYITIALFVSLFINGCKDESNNMESARRFSQEFHEKFNGGKYEEIYISSDIGLKAKVDKETFINSMKKIHESLGDVKSSNLIGVTSAKSDQGLNLVAAKFKTEYAEGTAEETFFLKPDENQITLFQYNIDSNDLIRKMINK
jgi:hypothetical protein